MRARRKISTACQQAFNNGFGRGRRAGGGDFRPRRNASGWRRVALHGQVRRQSPGIFLNLRQHRRGDSTRKDAQTLRAPVEAQSDRARKPTLARSVSVDSGCEARHTAVIAARDVTGAVDVGVRREMGPGDKPRDDVGERRARFPYSAAFSKVGLGLFNCARSWASRSFTAL